jgi:diguanylate cyclase (GGDEF)-like protein
MEDIRKRFRDITFTVNQKTFHVTLSVGVASLESGIERADQLLQEADAALYRAKSEGRNCVRSLRPSSPRE